MQPPSVPKPATLRKRYGLRAWRGIGQHFLTDPQLLDKIAACADIHENSTVIEIGMGPGYLTAQLLAAQPRLLITIEMDQRFFDLHQEVFRGQDKLAVHYGNALDLDFGQVLERSGAADTDDLLIVGNIPYQITSPLLFKIWQGKPVPRKVVFTMQREVAERLTCGPGTKNFGVLTIKADYYCTSRIEFEIGSKQFVPPPKVDSAVVSLTPHARTRYSGETEQKYFALINSAFAQRRKTIVNTLLGSPPFPIEKDGLLAALEECGIDPGVRAETIAVEKFQQLFDNLNRLSAPSS